jgi:hypothetical protein
MIEMLQNSDAYRTANTTYTIMGTIFMLVAFWVAATTGSFWYAVLVHYGMSAFAGFLHGYFILGPAIEKEFSSNDDS